MAEFNSIGVIGQGFVGTAVREGLRKTFDVWTYDKKEKDCLHKYGDGFDGVCPFQEGDDESKNLLLCVGGIKNLLICTTGPIFVCVPTPMKPNGECDISIVHDVMSELQAAACKLDRQAMVILKSTVPPGTTRRLNDLYDNLQICFNPEFLREACPNEDFANQDRIILGRVDADAAAQACVVFEKAFPGVPIHVIDSTTAEMVKYVTNVFLATKLSLSNELYQICKPLEIDWEDVWEIAALDKRLTESHWMVPGPDGHQGFGGSCFPKDINSLMRVAINNGIDPKVMRAVWEKNLEVRPERDWEKLIGRAVVE